MTTEGWVWKHVPRNTDTDNHSLKRSLMTSTSFLRSSYQKRWLKLDSEKEQVMYSKTPDQPIVSGIILVSDIDKVCKLDESEGIKGKTKWGVKIACGARDFILCVDSEDEQRQWFDALTDAHTKFSKSLEAAAEQGEPGAFLSRLSHCFPKLQVAQEPFKEPHPLLACSLYEEHRDSERKS